MCITWKWIRNSICVPLIAGDAYIYIYIYNIQYMYHISIYKRVFLLSVTDCFVVGPLCVIWSQTCLLTYLPSRTNTFSSWPYIPRQGLVLLAVLGWTRSAGISSESKVPTVVSIGSPLGVVLPSFAWRPPSPSTSFHPEIALAGMQGVSVMRGVYQPIAKTAAACRAEPTCLPAFAWTRNLSP